METKEKEIDCNILKKVLNWFVNLLDVKKGEYRDKYYLDIKWNLDKKKVECVKKRIL